MLIALILLIVLFGGFGYWGNGQSWGGPVIGWGGGGISFILLIILVLLLLKIV